MRIVSIHAPHEGERLGESSGRESSSGVSIHAPHEGERPNILPNPTTTAYVSIHAPHEGERHDAQKLMFGVTEFQSTLPTRGSDLDFAVIARAENQVSIHAPHEGERPLFIFGGVSNQSFNPRSPRGGATWQRCGSAGRQRVSIHAPHEGERLRGYRRTICASAFQSTLPTRGSDALAFMRPICGTAFQSTLPTRGSDPATRILSASAVPVSIHAPHEGERRRKSAFVCSISANLLNIIHCGTVTRAVSRRRIALFRLFSVRRSGVFMYAYASH